MIISLVSGTILVLGEGIFYHFGIWFPVIVASLTIVGVVTGLWMLTNYSEG